MMIAAPPRQKPASIRSPGTPSASTVSTQRADVAQPLHADHRLRVDRPVAALLALLAGVQPILGGDSSMPACRSASVNEPDDAGRILADVGRPVERVHDGLLEQVEVERHVDHFSAVGDTVGWNASGGATREIADCRSGAHGGDCMPVAAGGRPALHAAACGYAPGRRDAEGSRRAGVPDSRMEAQNSREIVAGETAAGQSVAGARGDCRAAGISRRAVRRDARPRPRDRRRIVLPDRADRPVAGPEHRCCPPPFPDHHQDAETLLFVLAFAVLLPARGLFVPRLADRIVAAPDAVTLSTLVGAAGGRARHRRGGGARRRQRR